MALNVPLILVQVPWVLWARLSESNVCSLGHSPSQVAKGCSEPQPALCRGTKVSHLCGVPESQALSH